MSPSSCHSPLPFDNVEADLKLQKSPHPLCPGNSFPRRPFPTKTQLRLRVPPFLTSHTDPVPPWAHQPGTDPLLPRVSQNKGWLHTRSHPPCPRLQPTAVPCLAEALLRAPPESGSLIHVPSGYLSSQPHTWAFILVFAPLHGETSFVPTTQMLANLVGSYPYCHSACSTATVLLYSYIPHLQ